MRDSGGKSGRGEGKRFPLRLAIAAGALLLGFLAWRIHLLYGGGTSEAEAIVYGMLLFLVGIVALAFLVVLAAKIVRRLLGARRRSPFEPPEGR